MKLRIGLILTLILLLPAIQPLQKSGLFTMHDDQQVVRLYQLDQALSDGHFPVRWVSDLGFGYGYPLFNFYPPLIYYYGWLVHSVFALSYIDAIKVVFATSFIGAAISMFYWSRYHFGTWAGILAAAFYTYAPYRSVDAYVRGALAEAFSFVWLPLILLAMDKVFEQVAETKIIQKKSGETIIYEDAHIVLPLPEKIFHSLKNIKLKLDWILVLGIAYGLLMLTHNLITLPFTLLMVVYFFLKLVTLSPRNYLDILINFALAGLIGVGLSAFFWIPALAEKQFTIVDSILLEEKYDYQLHFVYPSQLWNSIWGYGGSTAGTLDGLSFKIGKLHFVGAVVISLLALIIIISNKLKLRLPKVDMSWWRSHFYKQTKTILVLGLMFGLSLWLTLPSSKLIWENFSPLQFLQFPWRFLTFTTLFSSILIGATVPLVVLLWRYLWTTSLVSLLAKFDPIKINLFRLVAPKLGALIGFYYVIIMVVLLFIPNLKLFTPQTYLDVGDDYYTNTEFVSWKISGTSFEFVPAGVETRIKPDLNITQLAITQDEIATVAAVVVNGDATIDVIEDKTHFKKILVSASSISQIQFNTFNFPGWQLWLNDQPVTINDDNRLKLISTIIPGGQHQLVISFGETSVRNLANLISLITVILVTIMLIVKYRLSRPTSTKSNFARLNH